MTAKSVFITGANGFIGRALAERYCANGWTVRGMDLVADPERDVVAGDLSNPTAWADQAQGCELFIHTAAVVSLAADWDLYREVSVQGVRNALDAAIAAGAKRFVHFSSVAALGWDYPDGADETHPVVIGPHCRYGVAKGASEQVVLAAHAAGEIDCTIIRPGDVYGPGSRAWLLEPLKLARAGLLILPDGGKGIFCPIYIDDLLEGVELAASKDAGIGQIFHITGDTPLPNHEFFANHWRWAGRRGRPPTLPKTAALGLTKSLFTVNKLLKRQDEASPDAMLFLLRRGNYSNAKAKKMLGFVPKVGLEEGLANSEAWLREVGEL